MTPTSNQATAVGLGDVPPELVLEIVRNLALSDKCHLMVTCRGMHNLIQDLLYEDDLKSPDPCALRFAYVTGDVSLIEAMLDRGTPVDCVFSSYTRRKTSSGRDILCQRDRACTPLTTAVACRQLEAVKVLLRRGAHPNFAAVRPGTENLLAVLPISLPRPPTSLESFRPLQWAANSRVSVTRAAQRKQPKKLTEDIVRVLITNGADVNVDSNIRIQWRSALPLTLAVANRDIPTSVVRILLGAGSRRSGEAMDATMGPIGYFIRAELENDWTNRRKSLDVLDKEKIQLLLSQTNPSDLREMHQFYLAVLLKSPPTPAMLDFTRLYLSHSPILSKPWRYDTLPPLATAVRALLAAVNRANDIQRIVGANGDWSVRDLRDSYKDLFSLLIEFGAPLDPSEPQRYPRSAETALTSLCDIYCEDGDIIEDFVGFFLSKGASATGRDSLGRSPMDYAASNLLVQAANVLVFNAPIKKFSASGDKDNASEIDVDGSLSTACNVPEYKLLYGRRTRTDFAKLMINCGAQVNKIDSQNHSPLAYACKHGDVDLVRCPLSHGAAPDRDPAPYTPLQVGVGKYTYSSFTRHLPQPNDESMTKIVEMLLDSGAQVPMHWQADCGINDAKENGCPQRIIDLLLERVQAMIQQQKLQRGHKVG